MVFVEGCPMFAFHHRQFVAGVQLLMLVLAGEASKWSPQKVYVSLVNCAGSCFHLMHLKLADEPSDRRGAETPNNHLRLARSAPSHCMRALQ